MLGLAWAPWLAAPLRSLLRLVARRRTTRICFAWAGWSRRVVDPGTSEGNADVAHGVRSHEGRWTPGGRGDFVAATRVLLLVSNGGSRD